MLVAVARVAPCAGGAMLMALLTVAAHRPFRVTAAIGGIHAARRARHAHPAPRPDPNVLNLIDATTYSWAMTLAAIHWGTKAPSDRNPDAGGETSAARRACPGSVVAASYLTEWLHRGRAAQEAGASVGLVSTTR
jgi:hypothetical protein